MGLRLGLRKNRREMKMRIVNLVLSFALLGLLCPQPPAFSQETNQGEIKRKAKAKVEPRYPPLARQMKLSGKVKIEVTVSPDGRVKDTRIIGGSPVLVNAALDAIRMWRYESAPKETVETIEIEFKDPNQ
jgi:TonB family protein